MEALKLFFVYSHRDGGLRDELEAHLALLKRQEIIDTWHDRKITAGTELDGAIDANLREADIVLLLVSADFMASDYCYGRELKEALDRHRGGSAKVVPVILRECDWHPAPFGKLQALPRDGVAVTGWPNRDEAWADVARGIRSVAEELSALKTPRPEAEPERAIQVPTGPWVEIAGASMRVTERNSSWWRISWILILRNLTDTAIGCDAALQLLDEDGYILDDESLHKLVLEPKSDGTFRGYRLVNATVAPRVVQLLPRITIRA